MRIWKCRLCVLQMVIQLDIRKGENLISRRNAKTKMVIDSPQNPLKKWDEEYVMYLFFLTQSGETNPTTQLSVCFAV